MRPILRSSGGNAFQEYQKLGNDEEMPRLAGRVFVEIFAGNNSRKTGMAAADFAPWVLSATMPPM
jgi:hypothetical protein